MTAFDVDEERGVRLHVVPVLGSARSNSVALSEIAVELGYANAGGAHKAIEHALDMYLREASAETVQLERLRLETPRALELRSQGATFADIAVELGLPDPTAAQRRVAAEYRHWIAPVADPYLSESLSRLDDMWAALWPAATASPPDHRAIRQLLHIQKTRTKLLRINRSPRRSTRTAA